VRQYPLQALRRPYRRLPCRWRRDAAPGRTRHCPSLHLASQREDAPAPMDRTARLRQETPRGSSPGMPPAAATKRRPWIWPRTPTKKSEHPGVQTGPPEVAAAGGGGIQSLAAQGGRPDLHLHAAFLAFLHPICRW
jgi:hypothetical protein